MIALQQLVKTERIAYLVVASADSGETVAAVGDPGRVHHQGLIANLVGSRDRLAATSKSLEGQILPQIWAQGTVAAYAFVPRTGLIAVAFENTTLTATAQFERAREIGRQLEVILA